MVQKFWIWILMVKKFRIRILMAKKFRIRPGPDPHNYMKAQNFQKYHAQVQKFAKVKLLFLDSNRISGFIACEEVFNLFQTREKYI